MSNNQLHIVQEFYPQASSIKDNLNNLLTTLKKEYGITTDKITYADSFCSDELCTMNFPSNKMLGPFKLGGLGGYPFSKLTGMGAFAGHLPKDGTALIFYGPHVGITAEGNVGSIKRIGKPNSTGCCGSVTAALNNLLEGSIKEAHKSEQDYQQNVIEQILLKNEKRIKSADQKFIEAIDVMYEAIEEKIDQLVSQTDFNCKYLIKSGGVFINSDNKMYPYWAAKNFDIIEL